MTEFVDFTLARNARLGFYQCHAKWRADGKSTPEYEGTSDWGRGRELLCWLLRGHRNTNNATLMKDMTQAEYDPIRTMSGPHGWAVYKALVIKRHGSELPTFSTDA